MFLTHWTQKKLINILEEIFWTGLSAALWCIASILVTFSIVLVALEDSGCPRREEKVKIHQIDDMKVV